MIPVVVRSTEEMLKLVPNELREASYALGVPKWKTMLRIVLPTCFSGIVTGSLLGLARVMGETAPLLLLAAYTKYVNQNLFGGSMAALPTFIYTDLAQHLRATGCRPRLGRRVHADPHRDRPEPPRPLRRPLRQGRSSDADTADPVAPDPTRHLPGWPLMSMRIDVTDLNVYYGDFQAVEDVNMTIEPRSVTAFIGPSGCGKSTFLRTLNRMHEVIPGARVEGEVLLDGQDLYGPGVDPVDGAPHDRHGLPAAQPVPDDVDLRQRAGRRSS